MDEINTAKERVLDPLIMNIKKSGISVDDVERHGSPAEMIIYATNLAQASPVTVPVTVVPSA